MMMMNVPPHVLKAAQLQAPSKFNFQLCPTKQTKVVGVRRSDGLYFKYIFDEETQKLQPLECLECQPTITEEHLFPMYSVFCEKIWKHVIFTFNSVTNKVEQYVFEPLTGGFEEVNIPELVYHSNRPVSEVICTIEKTGNTGMTLIQRHDNGNIKKLRFVEKINAYVSVPPVYVRTLLIQKFQKMTEGAPIQPKRRYLSALEVETLLLGTGGVYNGPSVHEFPSHILQHCKKIAQDVVCIRLKDGSFKRFYYDELLMDFQPIEECVQDVTENELYPIYAVFWKPINNYVLFVRNHVTLKIEQYVFNMERSAFEQVDMPEVVYNPDCHPESRALYRLNNYEKGFTILIGASCEDKLEKNIQMHHDWIPRMVIPARVLTFEVKRKEEEERKKKEEEAREDAEFNDDYEDEWSNKGFSKFMSTFSDGHPSSLDVLGDKYEELRQEILKRTDRLFKKKKYNTESARRIITRKIGEAREMYKVLQKYLPDEFPEQSNSSQSSSSPGTMASSDFHSSEYDLVEEFAASRIY